MLIAELTFSLTGNTDSLVDRASAILAGYELAPAAELEPSEARGLLVASPVLYRGLPGPIESRLAGAEGWAGKPALLVLSYGMMAGGAPRRLRGLAESAGLKVVAGIEVAMPESFPPFVAKGWTDLAAPSSEALAAFDRAVAAFRDAVEGRSIPPCPRPRRGLMDLLAAPPSRARAVRDMGALAADPGRCSRCGSCAALCPAGAIGLPPSGPPSFDESACIACYGCYNRCPEGAIEAAGMKGRDGRYRRRE